MNYEIDKTENGGRIFTYPDLHFKAWGLILNYSPEIDSRIRTLLTILEGQYPSDFRKKTFIEKLAKYWNMKISFYLDVIWSEARNRPLTEQERKELLLKVAEVEMLIETAITELDSHYARGGNFLSDYQHRLPIEIINSFLKEPLEQGAARFIEERHSDNGRKYETTTIGIADQIEDALVIIPPLPKLDADDLSGQQLRAAGLVSARLFGRVIVDGWNLSVIETEEYEYGVPLEEMLAEVKGCPFGLVYDSQDWMSNSGYGMREKTCSYCFRHRFCPGGDLFRASSLADLARKLRLAWSHRDDIQKALPQFAGKLPERNIIQK